MSERGRLGVERYFAGDKNSYDLVQWTKGNVDISDEQGKVLFVQPNVEAPSTWSQTARQIIASRYFYGENGTPARESSVRQIVGRVTDTFYRWAKEQKYFTSEGELETFRNELVYLTVKQMMSFNSPVWFNAGVDKYMGAGKTDKPKVAYIIDSQTGRPVPLPAGMEYRYPQTSACFIQHVDDTMESIMQLAVNEAMLFKYGSGTGTDLSTLRSSREKLAGGGKPSGPMAYLQFYDRVAGIVKSGGKTRRAAKMNSLRADHPDIKDFVEAKAKEQIKLEALMDYLHLSFKEAEETVAYQNANLSVRANDEFMRSVETGGEWQTVPVHNKEMADKMPKYKAKDLLRLIAEGTHKCGDPGMQFQDTINRWHTCPNSAPINASNPCSEYMFVDNSSCNLASQNLMKFMNGDGTFNVDGFANAIRLTAIAQDLEIDNSCFPTAEIAGNSHKFRPLGMGYANLGAMLMSLGLPYDSDEGRATAAAVTALLTGKVYETSTEMAEKIGPFKEFEKNRDPMLRVIEMHKSALKTINRSKLPKGLEGILDEAEKTWEQVSERGAKYGFRNAQATVLAPTGTIGFMMDCDTTGIEPETWLVKTKKLTEGGTMKLVNNTVGSALKRLGYSSDKIKSILDYITEKETIEGSELKPEHLPVFDCAYRATNGKRTIHYLGHLKMMSAVQPFLSGAISKTVGLPNEATAEEIEKTYMDAWKMGIKAVALYRDGSKRWQPLSVKKDEGSREDLERKVRELEKTLLETRGKPVRKKLPITTDSIRHKFNLADHEGYLHIGKYPDGTPGEIFISMAKEGSTIGGLMDAFATSLSLCLQYGVPLEDLAKKFRHQKFDPRGFVREGHPDIHAATSVVDYISHFMQLQFVKGEPISEEQQGIEDDDEITLDAGVSKEKKKITVDKKTGGKEDDFSSEEPGGICITCGSQMIKKGHCNEFCPTCKTVSNGGCGG